jgi:hypothetical protein
MNRGLLLNGCRSIITWMLETEQVNNYYHKHCHQWLYIVCFWHDSPKWGRASSFTRFLDHTWRCTTVSRNPLDEWSAHRSDVYLTTRNTHDRHPTMPPAELEPTISAGKLTQTCALECVATRIGNDYTFNFQNDYPHFQWISFHVCELRTYTLAVNVAMNLISPLFQLHLFFHMTLTYINLGEWGQDLDDQCCGPPKLILWPQMWSF